VTLQLLVRGSARTLHLECEGQIDLPKQPPFDVATPGSAILVTVEVGTGSPNVSRMFDAWYTKRWRAEVTAYDGGPCVRAAMLCVEMNWERGLQVTRPWSEPLRQTAVDGQCVLYRPTPRHQLIKGMTNRYVLASDQWEQMALPECFRRRTLTVESVN
jgi:hypothetical protein